MAYASYFNTEVCHLSVNAYSGHFIFLTWTMKFMKMKILDFEIILRDNKGNNVGNFIVNDIHVMSQGFRN